MTEKNEDHVAESLEIHEEDHSKLDLRGTFTMVLFLGALMFVSWFGAFMLFLGRM
jgi:hypothetical protein